MNAKLSTATAKLSITLVLGAGIAGSIFAALPDDYQEITYIESTGTQHIMTDVVPTAETRVVVDFQMTRLHLSTDFVGSTKVAFYSGIQGSKGQLYFGVTSADQFQLVYGNNWQNVLATDEQGRDLGPDMERHVVEIGNGLQKFDGKTVGSLAYGSYGEKNLKFCLFKLNTGSLANPMWARVYSFRVFEGETLAHDYVPCYRKSDGRAGLYDTAEGVAEGSRFLSNAATGDDFTKGKDLCEPDPEVEPGSYERYAYQSDISFGNLNLNEPLADFPILVRISSERISGFDYAKCASDGRDIAFALVPDGTFLDYEVERWKPGGESLVWVKVPSLSAMTHLRFYWGLKDGQTVPAVKPADVWTAADYAAVWHMDALDGADSTGDNEFVNSGVRHGTGPIGRCAFVYGAETLKACYAQNVPWAMALAGTKQTISFWVDVTAFAGWGNLMAWDTLGGASVASGCHIGLNMSGAGAGHGKDWYVVGKYGYSATQTLATAPVWDKDWTYLDQWVHFAMTVAREDEKDASGNWVYDCCIYLNGSPVWTWKPTGKDVWINPAAKDFVFFNASGGTGARVRMDEFRISPVARDAAYVAAAYRSMADDTFLQQSAGRGALPPTEEVEDVAIQVVTVDEISATSGRIVWNVMSTGSGSSVEMQAVCGVDPFSRTVTNVLLSAAEKGIGSATLTGLAPNRSYFISLRAVDKAGVICESTG